MSGPGAQIHRSSLQRGKWTPSLTTREGALGAGCL
jgi:hypothetical protein